MACFHPLPAHRDRDGGPVRIGRSPALDQGDRLDLPCGTCIGCKLDRSREWSVRIMHESMCWPSSCFLTLSYRPESLRSLSLEYPDFQRFMKRLRRQHEGLGDGVTGERPIRFFCAGEYGDRYQRPHFHAIVFNHRFKDEVRCGDGSYRSGEADALWSHGFVHIGDVTPQSAAYVAGYTLEKVHGAHSASYYDVVDPSTGEVTERRPPFCTMSRRPGIGAEWYEKFAGDLFPHDFAVTADGQRAKVPRFYLRRFEDAASADDSESLRYRRYVRARAVPRSESSPERRVVREELARRRMAFWSERSH